MLDFSKFSASCLDVLYIIRSHVLLFMVVLPLCYIVYEKNQPGLRKVPGPFWASISGFWRVYQVYKGDLHETNIKLHQEYGPLVRLAPNVVSVADPDAIRIIYGLNSGFTKVTFRFECGFSAEISHRLPFIPFRKWLIRSARFPIFSLFEMNINMPNLSDLWPMPIP